MTDYPTIPQDRIDDLHNLENAANSDLNLFMAGNQFMAMPEIVSAFQAAHPEIGQVYYETLPPGLELRQILAGGAFFRGGLLAVRPDIYTSVSEKAMKTLEKAALIAKGDYHLYLHNRLALMVPKGNPANITSVADLAGGHVRISQPDPKNEDIAFHIVDMYEKAGGKSLVKRIMEDKRAEGTTILTIVHHRETPLRIKKRTVDAGPVWATEIVHARTTGLAFDVIDPGENLDQRDRINYFVCRLKDAPHPENALEFLEFIRSETAGKIYGKYGFTPV